MKILALDSSASPASVAVLDNGKILAEFFINTGFTHSQTLMPMIESVLTAVAMSVDDMDLVAVSKGPGSFTGVRIGVAAVKGLCFGKNIQCAGVSTLEAMAYNFVGEECIVFSVMDARRSQVYNAVFEVNGANLSRLCEDRAVAVDSLCDDIEKYCGKKIFLVGDGAALCYNALKSKFSNLYLAEENRRYQTAFGVAMAAQKSEKITPAQLMPSYLRLPQAERELKLKRK